MATIPTGTFIAAQRCRQQQRKAAMLRQDSRGSSQSCTPEGTPPHSPRKDSPLTLNPFSKLTHLFTWPGPETSKRNTGSMGDLLSQSLDGRSRSESKPETMPSPNATSPPQNIPLPDRDHGNVQMPSSI